MTRPTDYLDQLTKEGTSGLEGLCQGSLAAMEVGRELLEAAVRSQVEIKHDQDFRRLPEECQKFLDALKQSSDRDLAAVVTKALRSIRFAAFTHIVGKEAVYDDQPLDIKL